MILCCDAGRAFLDKLSNSTEPTAPEMQDSQKLTATPLEQDLTMRFGLAGFSVASGQFSGRSNGMNCLGHGSCLSVEGTVNLSYGNHCGYWQAAISCVLVALCNVTIKIIHSCSDKQP